MRQYTDESRLRAVVETAVDGVILIDAQGCVEMFNPACERLFGYSADEVIGQNVKMLMPPPERDEHDRYLGNFRRTGERRSSASAARSSAGARTARPSRLDLSVGEADARRQIDLRRHHPRSVRTQDARRA